MFTIDSDIPIVSPTKNKSCSKVAKFCSKNEFFSVRLLGFEIWSVLCTYGHFDVCDLMYAKDLRDFCEPDSDANQ